MGTLWYNLATKRIQKNLKHCPQYCPNSCLKLIQLSKAKSNIKVNIKTHIWSSKIKSFLRLFQSMVGFRGFQISLIIFLWIYQFRSKFVHYNNIVVLILHYFPEIYGPNWALLHGQIWIFDNYQNRKIPMMGVFLV